MHVPTDRSLITWIRELEKAGKLYELYRTTEYRRLRREVLEEHHNECYDCRQRGKYTPAVHVHHDKEVKDYPELAMSKFWYDKDGKHLQLIPLWHACHDKRHGRFFDGRAAHEKKMAEIEEKYPERW